VKTVALDAMAILREYRWPGNVRELRNVVERLVIMVPGPIVTAGDLAFLDMSGAPLVGAASEPGPPVRLQEARDRFERDYILQALSAQRGNISRAAETLGLERSNLYRKMRGFGIRSPRQIGLAAARDSIETPTPDRS
jgi:two-component system nitrogen regulation response regulator NtrX